MKPRTKLEKRVTELSGKLPAITKEQKDWAKKHLFDHFAYKCKDELWCSECGKMWVNTSKDKLGDKIECPYCHHQLDVKVSRKQKNHEETYMSYCCRHYSGVYRASTGLHFRNGRKETI